MLRDRYKTIFNRHQYAAAAWYAQMGGTGALDNCPALSLNLSDEFMLTAVLQMKIMLQTETSHKVIYGWDTGLSHRKIIGAGAKTQGVVETPDLIPRTKWLSSVQRTQSPSTDFA